MGYEFVLNWLWVHVKLDASKAASLCGGVCLSLLANDLVNNLIPCDIS